MSNVYRLREITGIAAPFAIDPAKPLSPNKANVVKVLTQSFDDMIDALPRITAEQLERTWHIPSWKGAMIPMGGRRS